VTVDVTAQEVVKDPVDMACGPCILSGHPGPQASPDAATQPSIRSRPRTARF